MAITVKMLSKDGAFLYKMNLLSGKNGLGNMIKWVHIIEDDNVSAFLHGNELVFTAGILNKNEDWLLNFARKLSEAGASAFVVNVGPYTKEIPASVIDYCNEAGLPLFTIPWETKMVDMTRDFCHRIMQDEHVENTIMTTMKNIIFKVGDPETQVLQMERYGFQRNSQFCFISVQAEGGKTTGLDEQNSVLKMIAESTAKNLNGQFITFTYNECRVLVLVNYNETEIAVFLDEFTRLAARKVPDWKIHMGISSNQAGIMDQNNNLEKAFSAMSLARKRNETVAFYDCLGIYKLLCAVSDKTLLRSYYHDTIGKLERYDSENGTRLTLLLKDYLDNNGSLQLVSEKQYVHRNTVTNQLKKIESITGHDPLELEDKIILNMGFYIRDIL